ncbi:MAG TPA: hypothetical protein VGR28_03040 [Candidatus Thermoplasmatota archaeon]|jgi:Flp pilus assembly protein TadB|nr:hypothetical protein [Candidatus Thermoplasmatota archaeon]
MDGFDRKTALHVERLRFTWDYITREADLHKQLHLQLLAAALAGLVAVVVSASQNRVPSAPAAGVASFLVVVIVYAQVRILRLRRRMRRSLDVILDRIDTLIKREAG